IKDTGLKQDLFGPIFARACEILPNPLTPRKNQQKQGKNEDHPFCLRRLQDAGNPRTGAQQQSCYKKQSKKGIVSIVLKVIPGRKISPCKEERRHSGQMPGQCQESKHPCSVAEESQATLPRETIRKVTRASAPRLLI